MSRPPAVAVGAIIARQEEGPPFLVTVVAGAAGLSRLIRSAHVQKTGLALAGFLEYVRPGRMLVFGQSETSFLASRPREERESLARQLVTHDIPCILTTAGREPSAELVAACEEAGIPLLTTPTSTGTAIAQVTALLEIYLAAQTTVHGNLVDVLGLGVLIVGESGIGKSEGALELVARGHRLIADDVVEVRRRDESYLEGTAPVAARYFMEVRGIGLIDVLAIFGISAVCQAKRLGLVVQLERWEADREYERLGLDEQWHELLGIRVPLVRMPVAPGRSIATLVDVAARNQLLKARGYHAARTLADRLTREEPR
jgi:HPr kinase/phosphorylase